MRIRLNEKSLSELDAIMSQLNVSNPTHCLQVIISTFYKSFNFESPHREDLYGNSTSKEMHPMHH